MADAPLQERARVRARLALGEEYFQLDLNAARIAACARPGQFAMVRCGDGPTPLLRRPLSFARIGADSVTMVVRAVGSGTRWLQVVQAGAEVDLIGPLGHGFGAPGDAAAALLVGGGIGVPPLLAQAEALARQGVAGPVTACVGGRGAADVVLVEELREAGAEVYVATEDGSVGTRGLVTAPLTAALERVAGPARIYACGPEGMLAAVARLAATRDEVACEVSLEAHMCCGVGACLGCAVTTADGGHVHVCADGPVFPAERIYGGAG